MKKRTLVLIAALWLSGIAWAAGIELQAVESSLIGKAGYDPAARTLAIQFVNSSDVYLYRDVPPAVYDGFLAAESKGGYFVANIKGKFATDKSE
jgi:hypothetical protein